LEFETPGEPLVPENLYRGVRAAGGVLVTVNDTGLQLAPSLRVRNHSPTGFEYGYGGSGPAQLALAILLHEYDQVTAVRYYQHFKWRAIARLNRREPFELTSAQIAATIAAVDAALEKAVTVS
jgi:hypothetical protein